MTLAVLTGAPDGSTATSPIASSSCGGVTRPGGALRIHALLTRSGVHVSASTVHRLLKRHGFLLRIVKKPASFKRFQRRYPDSLWQMDTDAFRIAGVKGKVYVVTILDDRSRY